MRDVTRRALVHGSFAAGALTLIGCSSSTTDSSTQNSTPDTDPESTTNTTARPRVLLAFFSRAGENYYYGGRRNLEVGNTQVLAGLIADRIACDRYQIEAAEPYSRDYEATVRRNVEEQDADARPKIARELPDLGRYDVVLLASPIWNVRPPMIMKTFAQQGELAGKTIHPVVTYAVSGMGRAGQEYRESAPSARLGQGLAVQGEQVAGAGADIDQWLARTGLA